MLSSSLVLLLLSRLALMSRVAAAIDDHTASRLDLLEQRIASLEMLTITQSATIEELTKRKLESDSDGCLPKRNIDNVCVYDDDAKFFFQNADLVFNSSTVRFTGPILEFNTTDSEGNMTNLTGYDFSSQVIFESTDILVENSNVSFTAEHNYTAFETNKTNITQYYGYVNFNNTEVALNSSRFFVTGPSPREVNRSLYDDLTYANLFPSVGFSFTDITIEDSNTTFTTNSSSDTDDSNVTFNHTEISYRDTHAMMRGATLGVEHSSISYGKYTEVKWQGESSKASFIDRVDFKVENSDVIFDDTNFELTGRGGRFVTRVNTHVRGPESGDPIAFETSRLVDVTFEQDRTMDISANVDFKDGSEIVVDDGADLVIDGKFESNNEAEFHGDIEMTDVKMFIKGDLLIDGQDGYDNADIEFQGGVEVKFVNDVRMERDLFVSEHTVLESLDVSDTTTVGGRLHCRKGATISGDSSSSASITSRFSPHLLSVEGSATVSNNLKAGTGSVNGELTATTIKADDIVSEHLDVTEMANIRQLEVTGATKLYSLTVGSNAIVSGTTTLGSLTASSGSITGQLTSGSLKSNNGLSASSLTVSGKTTTGSLDVTEEADIGGDLSVGGSTELENTVFLNLSVLGKATVGSLSASSATISGATTAQTLTVTGDASVGGDLDVDGSTDLANTVFYDVSIIGSANVGVLNAKSASISGQATMKTLAVDADADIGGDIKVGGSTEFGGDMVGTEPASAVFSDITVLGTATIETLSASTASVSNRATVQKLTVEQNAKVKGDIDVSSLEVRENTTVSNFTVDGNATMIGNLDVGGIFAPTFSLFQDIEVDGKATVKSLKVKNNAVVAGDLDVDGSASAASTVVQDINVLGTATVGTLEAQGAARVDTLEVNDIANIGGDLNVDGSTELSTTVFYDISIIGNGNFNSITADTATIGSLSANSATIDTTATTKKLRVEGNARLLNGLTVDGDLTVNGAIVEN